MGKRKHRGVLLMALGAVLMLTGAVLTAQVKGGLQYILPAPAASKDGGELEDLYEAGQKQLAGMADTLKDYGIGARKQGASLSKPAGTALDTVVYAVGEGYFDAVHETLIAGRTISHADVQKAEDVIVLDERAALAMFPGDDPLGKEVELDGKTFEVAGVIRADRRLGERDEHICYIPITTASRSGMRMQTVEVNAHGTTAQGSSILMKDTLSAWKPGGSFYDFDKLALGAVMPMRWLLLFAGAAFLLSLLSRMNAFTWGRLVYYNDQLKTRYARDMAAGMAGSLFLTVLGYVLLGAAAFLLAKFSIEPLYVFTEWVPEVVVELSSLQSRFWSLNDANAQAVRYVSSRLCQMEMGQGFLRWGLLAALAGLALHGIPWLNRLVEMPVLNTDH